MMTLQHPCVVQGSYEWKEMRKKHITATDVAACMGLNPWKDILQVYEEKKGIRLPEKMNAAMQRGHDLEEPARALFEKMTGVTVFPRVIIQDWRMASLDGIDLDDACLVEIKCGGKKLHDMAKRKVIPAYYRCQVMWQIDITNLDHGNYFSYQDDLKDDEGLIIRPEEGIILNVERNDEFIKEMRSAAWYLYECLQTNTPPIPRLASQWNSGFDICCWASCLILINHIARLSITGNISHADGAR